MSSEEPSTSPASDQSSKKEDKEPGEKKVGFAKKLTLKIPPPPQTPLDRPTTLTIPSAHSAHVDEFRKQSMFDQINGFKNYTFDKAKTSLGFGEKFAYWLYNKVKVLSRKWFTHCFLTIVLIAYTVGGAVSFQTLEGPYEDEKEPLDMRTLTYQLIEELTTLSEEMPFDNQTSQWKTSAEGKVKDYILRVIENRQIEAFIEANRGPKVWTLINSIVFCATIYTTIGYGHMFPKTHTGRALTIVYALIGIPLFLIALTDFGKLFTRGIKFLWSFVRRLYYTGSCRRVRKTTGVDDIFKGAQMMYDVATFRRPSMFHNPEEQDQDPENQAPPTDTPTTPAISNFEIDDEFNLPISVALFILVAYIFCGACIYMVIENWRFFEAFYFVFISMSTIGFGDYVPRSPAFMIISIIYLVFGLALMSMCFNVVQAKLSDTFKQASAKIGATIGLEVDENGSVITTSPDKPEAPPIPEPVAGSNSKM
ncbi:TWiK family of potassium channels protein 18-like isoform X2 [Sitophilus oryzae]|uniref:TWiK family of potassium channels protein 18-like isoform X1 n=1 Tax=Sitophilus oryzae TaxID=7048 RepID=A0A6J2Y5F4_SITOR|nr:TWiK family of potassium channels protein 18-like isoform X1 [Sitophilus oryzae]XP_030758877.1 TWiK family of potassium channels protein 18-like isoform X2 [Sitophilus oryzae]